MKADLHIHTVLSPCADLDMSPRKIVKQAQKAGLDIIGITDHNSTLQCKMVRKIAADHGIMVLCGAEVTSREEVHNLVFFENDDALDEFQEFIERNQPKVKNNPLNFGYQVIVNENDEIQQEIENYLGMALNVSVDELEEEVHRLGGLYIPAHVNRPKYGLVSQLGFVPPDIKADALEIFNRTPISTFMEGNKQLAHFTLLRNSDSHFLHTIGLYYNELQIEQKSFQEIKMALHKEKGRQVSFS